MKTILTNILALSLCLSLQLKAQERDSIPSATSLGLNLSEKAEFAGGEKALNKQLRQNSEYPVYAVENHISGTVYLKLSIGKDGYVTNAEVIRSPDESLSKEAIRTAKKLKGWIPAKAAGKAVDSWYILPVSFKLQ